MNTSSCDMKRRDPRPASLWDLQEGEYFFSTDDTGQRWFSAMFPGQTLCCIPIRPLLKAETNKGHSWEWDGNEDRPTLTPSVHAQRSWHGYVTAGRMVSV